MYHCSIKVWRNLVKNRKWLQQWISFPFLSILLFDTYFSIYRGFKQIFIFIIDLIDAILHMYLYYDYQVIEFSYKSQILGINQTLCVSKTVLHFLNSSGFCCIWLTVLKLNNNGETAFVYRRTLFQPMKKWVMFQLKLDPIK